jgi:hypothetical protein
MLVRSSDGKYEDIDFRETAPAAAFQDMYKQNVVMYFQLDTRMKANDDFKNLSIYVSVMSITLL